MGIDLSCLRPQVGARADRGLVAYLSGQRHQLAETATIEQSGHVAGRPAGDVFTLGQRQLLTSDTGLLPAATRCRNGATSSHSNEWVDPSEPAPDPGWDTVRSADRPVRRKGER